MIQNFSQNVKEALKYYVYVYSDPDTKKPFYVGKGKGNRAFSHLKNQPKNKESETEKEQKIKEIKARGKEPIIEILAHGLDEETALKVEAAAIDLIGINNLTNQQRGHESSVYGKIEVTKLNARYSPEKLNQEDVKDNLMLIKISQRYRNSMSPLELYEATRGYWRVKFENAKKIDYVLSVYDGMVLEVYEPVEWFPALSTYMDRPGKPNPENMEGRYEFVGKIANENIRNKYIDKSVKDFFAHNIMNPIKYVWANK
ncbi:hypothetical protein [uncultured Methanobrevibacter sp.]|uniref:LEM-3-like GIY-YIG domain-containing protein n=1 Tax=uncultured Methanobrevibacter sp. TaxID=253161 RepID=UPI0032079CD7